MPSSSRDVDLLFVALHQASLQCSQNSFLRYQMSRGTYFYDQYTRISHVGGIHRYKRHSEELNQALYHVRIALAAEDDEPAKTATVTPATTFNPTPSPIKQQQLSKQTNDIILRNIQRKLNTPLVPEILFKELDQLFQQYEDKTKTAASSSTPKLPSSIPSKSAQLFRDEGHDVLEGLPIQEAEDEDELLAATTNIPKVSLSGPLIIRLHSTWTDLIENAEYKYTTWRTKAGEDSWRRHVERKRVEQLNADKQRALISSKQANRRRANSRASITSLTNFTRQQQLSTNPQMRTNRSSSRVSFISINNMSQIENAKLLKSINQGSLESLTDSVKSGIHVEFKLSTQIDDTKQQQQSQIQALNEQKGVMFDVPKPAVDAHEDIIALIQTKCKRLLAEMKHKILAVGDSNVQDPKMCKVWFYGENQHIRSKTNLLTLNESVKRQRSKFIFSLLRREIPEKYDIVIDVPETKHICYIESIDGSIQIYYPSGRLAVLRLPLPNSCTIFFDDTDVTENQFLGLVTATGNVVIMQPTLHARFVSDTYHERGFLCNGKTGVIEKQLQCRPNNSDTPSMLTNPGIPNEEDEILPPLLENSVQFQLNSSMQLEYQNPTNIRFAFACHREEYKFQLGVNVSSQSPTSIEAAIKKLPPPSDKKSQLKSKLSTIISTSTNSNEISTTLDKQQIQLERLLDGQVNLRELPMLRELTTLRKRIKNICNNWLKECRNTLGVMDIDSYCLPDLSSTANPPITPVVKPQQSKSAKSPRQVSIATKYNSNNQEFLRPKEKEQITRTLSARKPQSNVIADTMMQFVPRSDSGKAIKQKIYAKKKFTSTSLPAIKVHTAPIISEENASTRIGMPLDLPFACPILIRQRLIQDGPISTILYDTCTCRADHVPLIHDLEFDKFIELTSHLNPNQLIVIGIINSNLRQIEFDQSEESNELYDILQTLHHNLNYGRSQICSCRLSTNDDYRCLIYDLAEATKQSSLYGPLLVRRHHVQPGFVLIYQHGQLIFGDSIFNGYGRNVQDLKKQLNHMRQQRIQQTALPEEFKFISDHRRSNTTVLKSV